MFYLLFLFNILIIPSNTKLITFESCGQQRWCIGESTRLPPVRPRFKSQHSEAIMWAEFVVGSLRCSESFFFSRYSGFPSPQKPTFTKSNSSRNQIDEEHYPYIITILFFFVLWVLNFLPNFLFYAFSNLHQGNYDDVKIH